MVHPRQPEKVRLCHDASAKTKGFCLNDMMLRGSDRTCKLLLLLLLVVVATVIGNEGEEATTISGEEILINSFAARTNSFDCLLRKVRLVRQFLDKCGNQIDRRRGREERYPVVEERERAMASILRYVQSMFFSKEITCLKSDPKRDKSVLKCIRLHNLSPFFGEDNLVRRVLVRTAKLAALDCHVSHVVLLETTPDEEVKYYLNEFIDI